MYLTDATTESSRQRVLVMIRRSAINRAERAGMRRPTAAAIATPSPSTSDGRRTRRTRCDIHHMSVTLARDHAPRKGSSENRGARLLPPLAPRTNGRDARVDERIVRENGPRGPLRRPGKCTRGHGSEICIDPRGLQDRCGEVEPRRSAAGSRVIDPRRCSNSHEVGDHPGDVDGPCGLPTLVVDHAQRPPLASEPRDGARKARPVLPVKPSRADYERVATGVSHERLALGLRPAVRRPRVGGRRLGVRFGVFAVEDVVGRHMNEPHPSLSARPREPPSPGRVDGSRGIFVGFRLVHRGERGAIHDDVAVGDDRRQVAFDDVRLGARPAVHGLAASLEFCDHIAAEHAGRAHHTPRLDAHTGESSATGYADPEAEMAGADLGGRMDVTAMKVPGAWHVQTRQFDDARGTFLEWHKAAAIEQAWGRPFTVAQGNCSVSKAGVMRGIHYADVPPGQAKYVTCVRGAVLDVVVDLREGSPTFGTWDAVLLDDVGRSATLISEGLGHAFLSLEDHSTVMYLCSTPFTPEREHGIDPLDADIGIEWPTTGRDGSPLTVELSDKDRAAPSLKSARAAGSLPTWEQYLQIGTVP